MKEEKGFVALVSILMIGALVLLVSVSVTKIAISQLQSGISQTNGESSWALTDGCVEDALLKIRGNASYSGGSISRPEGICNIVISRAGNVYTITVNTSATTFIRTVLVVATRTSTITVSKWIEI